MRLVEEAPAGDDAEYSSNREDTSLLSRKGRPIPQQLPNGRTYTLDPSRLTEKDHGSRCPRSVVTAIKFTVLAVVVVKFFPLLLFGGSLFAGFMYVAPVRVKAKLTSWWLPFICAKLDQKFAHERSVLLAECTGRVLDVGSGSGAYMHYFQHASAITALEPVQELHEIILKQAAAHGIRSDRLTVLAMDVETFAKEIVANPLHHAVEKEEQLFDWIILGNVLCEVESIETTLRTIDQLLKPNVGLVYFSEHIACPTGGWRRNVQNWLNPLWYTISNGCSINRDSLQIIYSMPGWNVIHWTYDNVRVGLGPIVLGLAHKQSQS